MNKSKIDNSYENKELPHYINELLALIHKHNLGSMRRYRKNEHIFHNNDPAELIYIIQKGVVITYLADQDGRERIRRFFSAGDILGHNTLFHGGYIADAQAIQPSKVIVIDKTQFLQQVESEPKLLIHLYRVLEMTHRNLAIHMGDSYYSAETRVLKYLLRLLNQFGTSTTEGIVITIPLTHELLAKYAGTTRVTVTRVLSRLSAGNILSTNPKPWIVSDLDALVELCEQACLDHICIVGSG
ncbi:Crp/Fnr family transcriptional regulator [Paenibacillus sp. IHBB 10380]|uniref:Crp/Fnr family transcriptional regulator n=1 Tax=Paenibacillus sp. IHBB 10380 TaxID=1566358 RepID=UPI0005CFCA50|nr:Crp/Fnr family transcriptional regulator [Paenibacillus sp. IHBB 10380]AJS58196.1 hypothetical protein UB51_06425 [Paenibacillus sp. IHBB 10380]